MSLCHRTAPHSKPPPMCTTKQNGWIQKGSAARRCHPQKGADPAYTTQLGLNHPSTWQWSRQRAVPGARPWGQVSHL